ncbi:uncharacterized protein LOC131675135 [Phymastichus coffea]|uniref:uncharacterized protein LOC131675135 n=1 Tax=Phymastichus coffea TaxID=108790 RepID=UPI00273AA996|nr:uncharacterized protein LOC131675135 [Phymastichus coffea]
MPVVQRNESPSLGRLFLEHLDEEATGARTRSLPERSVSFNRDVHVKRIGRGCPYVTTALVGDGEGRLTTTPVRKESIKARSKEDLAQEAAYVLQQADSVDCVALESPDAGRHYGSLPSRGRRAKQPPPPPSQERARRRRSEEIGAPGAGSADLARPTKKAALERSQSDASCGRVKPAITGPRSAQLERPQGPPPAEPAAQPSAGSSVKRSHSDAAASAEWQRKPAPLSPIIEAAPQTGAAEPRPFHFPAEAKKPKQDEAERRAGRSMLHGGRYEQPRPAEESAIHRMIHRLSADRSPPPQLTRAMVSPGPGFGHNNNRPFSYTRPAGEAAPAGAPRPSPEPAGPDVVIYAQVQLDKKKAAQRSHSDSDEGLGLERKDSSRENSPAEKDYPRGRAAGYLAAELLQQRNNRINSYKSRAAYEPEGAALLGEPPGPGKYTSTVFVEGCGPAPGRGRADGTDCKPARGGPGAAPSRSSELSARRDLLESRIKSRLLADEAFAAKAGAGAPAAGRAEHDVIIDKPIVPSPVVPASVAAHSAKRYTDTYVSETRTNSHGDKYVFEQELHDEDGRVYGYEKTINKLPASQAGLGLEPLEPRPGYTLETRTDGFGDRYVIETRNHGGYEGERARARDGPGRAAAVGRPAVGARGEPPPAAGRPARGKHHLEALRGRSKSTQRLDQLGLERRRLEGGLRRELATRSHENLASADYANARQPRAFARLDELREAPLDDYDTDISQATNSQLESSCSKYYRETRTTQSSRYQKSKLRSRDDYDSSPRPRPRLGYGCGRYDSDAAARDSPRGEQQPRQRRLLEDEPDKPTRRSRNRLDYLDDSDASRASGCSKGLPSGGGAGGTGAGPECDFAEQPPQRPPRAHHESKLRQSRAYGERRQQLRETRLSDSERKDRLADSGIENDYRREPHARPELESEDEGIASMQLIKQERRHTDRSMQQQQQQHQHQQRRYSDKYVVYYDSKGSIVQPVLASKPPSGCADAKKYEKKAAKKSGTMSKVKELFRKKEKKAKEEKSKRSTRAGSSGTLTDDELSMRYREYRGEQLRSAISARDLDSEIIEDEYRQRRRLSTPSGSPSPPRPSRLSRSTGTLTRPEQQFREGKGSRDSQPQEAAERRGWFKSLSRKAKSSAKPLDKKPRIPESEILTTGTEDEEASSAPERASVQKNLRFFGDTDQESLSSSRERRNKRGEEHAQARREPPSPSRQPMGRKSSRLAESALSSGESTTGDSSQQSQNSQRSQRSVVYLHAATVGEIPGPNERRRAASREELSRPLAAHTRTVSRSVSVLAPWRPRHYREPYEINYDQEQQHVKPLATTRRRQRSRETLGRRPAKEPRRAKDLNSKSSTINRGSLKPKDSRKVGRTVSTESLASKSRSVSSRPEQLSRSTSVPRDPNKSAGWFKLKSKKSRA